MLTNIERSVHGAFRSIKFRRDVALAVHVDSFKTSKGKKSATKPVCLIFFTLGMGTREGDCLRDFYWTQRRRACADRNKPASLLRESATCDTERDTTVIRMAYHKGASHRRLG